MVSSIFSKISIARDFRTRYIVPHWQVSIFPVFSLVPFGFVNLLFDRSISESSSMHNISVNLEASSRSRLFGMNRRQCRVLLSFTHPNGKVIQDHSIVCHL